MTADFASGRLDGAPTCPKCGLGVDGWTETVPGQGGPEPGDVTICSGCVNVLVFDENLKPVEPDEETYVELMTNPDIQNYIAVIRKANEG